DLAQWIFEEFRIAIAKQTLSRELRAMGYRKLSARPRHHAQAQGAIEDFKKAFPCAWRKSRAPRRSTATRERSSEPSAAVGSGGSTGTTKLTGAPKVPHGTSGTNSP